MQFVLGGPDVPERLLKAHEEGRVAFFCGAGVSIPAGLPNFEGLAREAYKRLALDETMIDEAFERGEYDAALKLMEDKTSRSDLLMQVSDILHVSSGEDAPLLHKALVDLANLAESRAPLVTTNFDRLFEQALKERKLAPQIWEAEPLPLIPEQEASLVYLHGALPAASSTVSRSHSDKLILTSRDFGRAYLRDPQTTARFVNRLFRHFTVCFVGYSLSDPMMRYLSEAMSGEDQDGEPAEIFAFAGYKAGKEGKEAREWRGKGVTPILYDERGDHELLDGTIQEWAKLHGEGVRGKERIVEEAGNKLAGEVDEETKEYLKGRLLWAISDDTGLPAQSFANLPQPLPLEEWLVHFAELPPESVDSEGIPGGLMMHLAPVSTTSYGLGRIGYHIARWLLRHLDSPELFRWVAERGGNLHGGFASMIAEHLELRATAQAEGEASSLPPLRPAMSKLWGLVLAGRVGREDFTRRIHGWWHTNRHRSKSLAAQLDLIKHLTPVVVLSNDWARGRAHHPTEEGQEQAPVDLIHVGVALEGGERVNHFLAETRFLKAWQAALPSMLPMFRRLLQEAMDLMLEIGDIDPAKFYFYSYHYQPSISEHGQNKDRRPEWAALITLVRESWLVLAEQSPKEARREAESWGESPYPVFQRLALFAAAHPKRIVPAKKAVQWLRANDGRLLWFPETMREVMRLLVSLGAEFSPTLLRKLEKAILAGPPAGMYSEQGWQRAADRGGWLRLKKLEVAGATLSEEAKNHLAKLSEEYPWALADDESDEFPVYIETSDHIDDEDVKRLPEKRKDLVAKLREGEAESQEQKEERSWHKWDNWGELSRQDFPLTCCTLYDLARADVWPSDRWDEALRAWGREDTSPPRLPWHYAAPILAIAPDEWLLSKVALEAARLLGAASKDEACKLRAPYRWQPSNQDYESSEELFVALAKRLLTFKRKDGSGTSTRVVDADAFGGDSAPKPKVRDPYSEAINHPVGVTVRALTTWWPGGVIENGAGMPAELGEILAEICKGRTEGHRVGRVVLFAQALKLFLIDPAWTERHLLPLFDWGSGDKAEVLKAWISFLWNPRLNKELLERLKPHFLHAVGAYEEFNVDYGEPRRALSSLFIKAAIHQDVLRKEELQEVMRRLPQSALDRMSFSLSRVLSGSHEERAQLWEEQIAPFIREVWPKDAAKKSEAVGEHFADLCVETGGAFPKALVLIRSWLQPTREATHIEVDLASSGLCAEFPEEALEFLSLIVPEKGEGGYHPYRLHLCLGQISGEAPALKGKKAYQRLESICRRAGKEPTAEDEGLEI